MLVTEEVRSSLREDQTGLTRSRIMEALVGLLQVRNPATLSMHDIAAEAGVSDRTLYRHYATKQDLYDGLFAWIDDHISREVAAEFATSEQWLASIPAAFAALERIKTAYTVLLRMPEAAAGIAASDAVRRRNINRAVTPLLARVVAEERRGRGAIAHLLGSSRALYFLQDVYGLSAAEAATACQGAIEAVLEADPGSTKG